MFQTEEKKLDGVVPVNKDHQRMMVDPMLLIVQSLWSFLTAVTTTAIVPIAVILTCNLPEYT